jgi:hypothetical protein
MRGEFTAVEAGFAKLPTLSGNGSLPLFVNAGATALEAVSASTARIRLALGSIATQNANNVAITGGSITAAPLSSNNVALTGGTISGVSALSTNNATITGGTISGVSTLSSNNAVVALGGSAPGVSAGSIQAWVSGGLPVYSWVDSTQAADGKVWEVITVGGAWKLRTTTDNRSSATDAISVTRAGALTIAGSFASDVTVNKATPTVTVDGTGVTQSNFSLKRGGTQKWRISNEGNVTDDLVILNAADAVIAMRITQATGAVSFPGGGISLTQPTIQTFTIGSGTYTTPANVKRLRIRVVGPGGGGSGGGAGAGSGSNGSAATTFDTVSAGVGVGATAGSGGSGAGGTNTAAGSATRLILGQWAGGAGCGAGLSSASGGVGGGSSLFGGAGGGGAPAATGTTAVANSGGGGGGGGGAGGASQAGGGGGAGGSVEFWQITPAASYSYAVGAGGGGGSGAAGGAAGGSGATGYIVVEEFYV